MYLVDVGRKPEAAVGLAPSSRRLGRVLRWSSRDDGGERMTRTRVRGTVALAVGLAALVAALPACIFDGEPDGEHRGIPVTPIGDPFASGALVVYFSVNMGLVIDAFATRNDLTHHETDWVMSIDSTTYPFHIDRTVVPASISDRAVAVRLVSAYPDTIEQIRVVQPESQGGWHERIRREEQ
jgi:hypothetical protein